MPLQKTMSTDELRRRNEESKAAREAEKKAGAGK